jgi:hypothetical protein
MSINNDLGFKGILKPSVVITTSLNLTKLGLIRKFRPKFRPKWFKKLIPVDQGTQGLTSGFSHMIWSASPSLWICTGWRVNPVIRAFFYYSFRVHHPVNWDDRHLPARAMASDFSVTWLFSQREQLVFHYGSNSMPYLTSS